MKIELTRLKDNGNATLGLMKVDGEAFCFTLEDEFRAEKIKGETRIPAGKYAVKFREVLSPMTKRYRDRYDWFTYHLELQDVPGFTHVYIHIGNTEKHTDGCVLVGLGADFETMTISKSRQAFKELYLKAKKAENIEILIK